MKGLFAAAAFLALSLYPAFGQAAEPGAPVSRRLLVSISYSAGFELSEESRMRISRSLLVALARAEGVRLVEYGGEPRETRKQWAEEAEKAGADCWLSAVFQGTPEKPSLKLTSYDVARGKTAIDESIAVPYSLSEPGEFADMWEDAVSLVAAQYYAVNPEEVKRDTAKTARLSFTALPGTTISGLPGGPVSTGKDGTAAVKVPIPASYTVTLSCQTYFPVTMQIYVDSPMAIPVHQEQGSYFGADFTFVNNLFPGAAAVVFPVPNFIYVKLGIDSYLIGLALGDQSVFFSLPLTTVNLQAGFYCTPEEFVPRISLFLGAFLRIAHLADNPFMVDALCPVGGVLGIGAEIGPTPRHRFFLEYSTVGYFTSSPELLWASISPGDRAPDGYVNLGSLVLNVFNLRFGFRWLL